MSSDSIANEKGSIEHKDHSRGLGPEHDATLNQYAAKGDDSDGQVSWTFTRALAGLCLCGLYVGSQIPLYFVGGSLGYIEADLGTAGSSWLPVSNTLAIAAVAPFVGYLQDIFGRRYITLIGGVLLCIGCALVASAHSFGQGVSGMSIAGAGAAICELTALAGVAEIAPVRQRGIYVGVVTGNCFRQSTPGVGDFWICLIVNAAFLVGVTAFYHVGGHRRGDGLSRREILAKMDFVGGFLSIVGLTLFLVALQAGGYQHPWGSAPVLAPMLVGLALIAAFVVYEAKLAKNPMIPKEIFRGQKVVALCLVIAFVSGMNFYSLLNFFPLTFTAVYNPDPVQVGLKALGYGFSVTIGATVMNSLLSVFRGANREMLVGCCIIMTAFGGALAVVDPTNPKTAVALGTVAGFGVGGVLVPALTMALIACPDEFITTVCALGLSVRVIGGSIGYTIYYNIFVNKLTARLPVSVAQYAIGAGLPAADAIAFVTALLGNTSTLADVPNITPDIIAAGSLGVKYAYAYGLSYVWYTSIAFGAISIIACCFLPNIKKFQTNRIAVAV